MSCWGGDRGFNSWFKNIWGFWQKRRHRKQFGLLAPMRYWWLLVMRRGTNSSFLSDRSVGPVDFFFVCVGGGDILSVTGCPRPCSPHSPTTPRTRKGAAKLGPPGLPREAAWKQSIRGQQAQLKGTAGAKQFSSWLGQLGQSRVFLAGHRSSRDNQSLVLAAFA